MLKEALEYIVGLRKPEIVEVGGETYSDKPLERIDFSPMAEPIVMGTLTSFCEYIRAKIDDMSVKMIVHVESPTCVRLYSDLDYNRQREYIAVVKANIPEFPFDQYVDHEKFLISMQSKFIDDASTDKALLLKFAGTVKTGTVAQYGDDGVTQKATIKTGIASMSDAIVPSVVRLKPYRTFLEVEQPTSDFVFRMKEGKYDSGVQCAIFEADGGAWKAEAMENIKAYLKSELNDLRLFTVIS